MTALGIFLVIVGMVFLYILSTQRSLVKLDEMANNSLSQISVQLNSRWDAVSALVNLTGKYSSYEYDTLTSVIAQRRMTQVVTPESIKDQQSAIGQLLGRLMAISEAYPELKASEIYQKTMQSIETYEENVRLSRLIYNDSVTKMNRMVRQWPSSFVASMLHFGLRSYLEEDADKKDFPPMDKPSSGKGHTSPGGGSGIPSGNPGRNVVKGFTNQNQP